MNFPVSTDTFERQLEKFEYNIRKYEGLEEDTDLVPYMNIMYWDNEKNDRLVIPLDEATKEQKSRYNILVIMMEYVLNCLSFQILCWKWGIMLQRQHW